MLKVIFLQRRNMTRIRRKGRMGSPPVFLSGKGGHDENRTDYGGRSHAGHVYRRSDGCNDGAWDHL